MGVEWKSLVCVVGRVLGSAIGSVISSAIGCVFGCVIVRGYFCWVVARVIVNMFAYRLNEITNAAMTTKINSHNGRSTARPLSARDGR